MASRPDTTDLLDDSERPTIGFHRLRVRFGRADYSDDRFTDYLTLLVRDHGFPPPLPRHEQPRRRRRSDPPREARLETGVHHTSKWIRKTVDAWFEDYLPPANAAQVEAMSQREAANDMDLAATRLHLVGGREA